MKIDHEILAKLIFAVSQQRYFEKESLIDPNLETKDIAIKWQCKVDEVLQQMGVDGYMPLNHLKEILKLSFNAKENPEEKDKRMENATEYH